MATRKKTTTKKVVPAKKEEVTINSALKIIKEYKMGIVELSENQAICVSIIINADLNSFVSVRRVYRAKTTDEWKIGKSGAIWLPFREMHNICDVLIHAYDEGLKMGLDNVYRPTEPIYRSRNDSKPSNNSSVKPYDDSTFNPELWAAVLEVGLFYFKKSNKISEWKDQMLSACGDKIELLLPAILKMLQSYPQDVRFDEGLMILIFEHIIANFEDGITDFYEINEEILNLFDSPKNKEYVTELAQAVYNGLKVFFEKNNYSMKLSVSDLKLTLDDAMKQITLF